MSCASRATHRFPLPAASENRPAEFRDAAGEGILEASKVCR
jgi:hypothetical protein